MSGFIAVLHADGRPVERQLVSALTKAMRFRGPDGTATHAVAAVAMGHARLETSEQPDEASQPLLFDERLWVVGDVRLDARDDLLAALAKDGREDLLREPDHVLLAHAYDVWGTSCVEHLRGDFSFLIWDENERLLFGARDQIGVKPLYYAATGRDFLAGNTLEALRAHPDVADELDEHAIGDFLLFGINRHPERTSFAAVSRLPPGHILLWRAGEAVGIERYWKLGAGRVLTFTAADDIVERFRDLLRRAVADRLRGGRAVVLMSGGLDSTTVAAVAQEIMQQGRDDIDLTAVTVSLERLLDDREPEYAAEAAAALNIPLRVLPLDDDPRDLWGPGAAWSAEPVEVPASRRTAARFVAALDGARVVLTGQGGDPLLHVTPSDAAHRVKADGLVATAIHMWRYRAESGHLPRSGLRTHVKRRLQRGTDDTAPPFPPWLRADLVRRLGLRDRYRACRALERDPSALRPEATAQLGGPEWSFLLEWYDAGSTGFQVQHRHPFFDLRVIEFLLALPVMPWLVEKEIVRRAMRSRLPAAVLTRRKAPLAGNPVHRALVGGAASIGGLAGDVEDLAQFIDMGRFQRIAKRPERLHEWEAGLVSRPLALAMWLRRLQSTACA